MPLLLATRSRQRQTPMDHNTTQRNRPKGWPEEPMTIGAMGIFPVRTKDRDAYTSGGRAAALHLSSAATMRQHTNGQATRRPLPGHPRRQRTLLQSRRARSERGNTGANASSNELNLQADTASRTQAPYTCHNPESLANGHAAYCLQVEVANARNTTAPRPINNAI